MKILVGSKNPGKIKAAKQAFKRYFENIEIMGIAVDSGVSEEPLNNEIMEGVQNRIEQLWKANPCADYYVAVESGLINLFGQWMIISIAAVRSHDGIESYGTSPSFPVPEKYISKIISGTFNQLIAEIFEKSLLSQGNGGISLLTHHQISRIDLSEQAIIMALTSHLNGTLWQNQKS